MATNTMVPGHYAVNHVLFSSGASHVYIQHYILMDFEYTPMYINSAIILLSITKGEVSIILSIHKEQSDNAKRK